MPGEPPSSEGAGGETGGTETDGGSSGGDEPGDSTGTADGGEDDSGSGSGADDTAEPPRARPTAIVADNSNERYLLVDLESATLAWEYNLEIEEPECAEEGWTCGAYGMQPGRDGEDDTLITTWHRMHNDISVRIGSRESVVEQLRITEEGTSIDWRLDGLDFLSVMGDGGEHCTQTEACVAPTTSHPEWSQCTLVMVHDVEVLSEAEGVRTVLLADTGNSRALVVEVSDGDTCGVVTEVFSQDTVEGWKDKLFLNDVDHVVLDGEPRMLASHKGFAVDEACCAGRGSVELYGEDSEGAWSQLWRFPADPALWLSAQHNADVVMGTDGKPYVVVAHSNGHGAGHEDEAWGGDTQNGSISVLRLSEDGTGFTYLADVILPTPFRFNFLRDVDRLEDGSWLVTDSGCKAASGTCTQQPHLWHLSFEPEAFGTPGLGGGFLPDHSDQSFVMATVLDDWTNPLDCDFLNPYEADFLWSSELGPGLSAAIEAPAGDCTSEE